ncbi:MAG: hypothetical protein DMD91_03380 [Candidatus Rokuibacteriota bacterium]|nr:MAG: hypothetical protein DMD91_03380 [Candidatus Rokubacteria bacterium]
MSIYATLWRLKFPSGGDDHTGCAWTEVIAQGVPAHIGAPHSDAPGDATDPYASFLPPAVIVSPDDDDLPMRAVVFVTEGARKGTERSGQEYVNPLLVLSGHEYTTMPFGDLHEKICSALRGHRPRLVAESRGPDGRVRLLFEDGTVRNQELA